MTESLRNLDVTFDRTSMRHFICCWFLQLRKIAKYEMITWRWSFTNFILCRQLCSSSLLVRNLLGIAFKWTRMPLQTLSPGSYKGSHMKPILMSSHWLPFKLRKQFKICLITDVFWSGLCGIRCSRFKMTSDCAFEVVAPKLWKFGLINPFKGQLIVCSLSLLLLSVIVNMLKTKLCFTNKLEQYKVWENIEHRDFIANGNPSCHLFCYSLTYEGPHSPRVSDPFPLLLALKTLQPQRIWNVYGRL